MWNEVLVWHRPIWLWKRTATRYFVGAISVKWKCCRVKPLNVVLYHFPCGWVTEEPRLDSEHALCHCCNVFVSDWSARCPRRFVCWSWPSESWAVMFILCGKRTILASSDFVLQAYCLRCRCYAYGSAAGVMMPKPSNILCSYRSYWLISCALSAVISPCSLFCSPILVRRCSGVPGHFICVLFLAAEVVDGDCTQRRPVQAFVSWNFSFAEIYASSAQGRFDKQRRVHHFWYPNSSECAAESIADVIVIYNSDWGDGDAPHSTVVEGSKAMDVTLLYKCRWKLTGI